MKKVFKFMMMALAAVVLTVGFAACSSDDDDDNGGSKPEPTEKASYLEMNFSFSEDMLSLFDLTVTYTDVDGSNKTETISTVDYSKKVNYTKAPSKIAYEVKAAKKANYPTKDSYAIKISYSHKISKNGEYGSGGISTTTTIKGDKVEDLIKKYDGKTVFGGSK